MTFSLTDKVISGASWLIIGRISDYIIQFSITAILVRLLSPKDYGIFAIALATTNFGGTVIQSGFAEALIQKDEVTEEDVQTVFWLTALIAAIVVIILNVFAISFADFYETPELEWILRILAFSMFIGSMGSVPTALLIKAFRTNTLTVIQLFSKIAYSVVTILLALLGYGVWSLLAGAVVNTLIITVAQLVAVKWIPRWKFSIQSLQGMLGFTLNLFGFKFVSFWSRNFDSLVLGRVFNNTALGFYNRAYGVMIVPASSVGNLLIQVMFPAFVALGDDKTRIKQAYLRSVSLLTFLIAPAMFGLVAIAESLVLTVFGEQWHGMISTLQILSPVGLIQAVVGSTYWIYMSQGKTGRMLQWELLNMVGVVIAVAIGVLLGSIEAVAFCYLSVNIVLLYPSVIIPGRLIDLRFREFFVAIRSILVSALIMMLGVAAVMEYFVAEWGQWQRLVLGICLGFVIYFGIIFSLKVSAGYDFAKIVQAKILAPLRLSLHLFRS